MCILFKPACINKRYGEFVVAHEKPLHYNAGANSQSIGNNSYRLAVFRLPIKWL